MCAEGKAPEAAEMPEMPEDEAAKIDHLTQHQVKDNLFSDGGAAPPPPVPTAA